MRSFHAAGLLCFALAGVAHAGVAHAEPRSPAPHPALPAAPVSAPVEPRPNVAVPAAGKLTLGAAHETALAGAFKGVGTAQLHGIATGDHVAMHAEQFDAARPVHRTEQSKRLWDDAKRDMKLQLMMTRAPNRDAILELGRRGDPESVPLLSKIALGEVHVHENTGVVLQTVSFSRGAINSPQDAAVVALGMVGGDEAVATLERILQSKPSSLVIKALGDIGGPKAVAALRSAGERRDLYSLTAVQKLAAMGDEAALHTLSRTFNEGKGMDREDGFFMLTSLGVPFLTKTVRSSPDPEVRLAAIRALGGMTRDHGVNADVSQFKPDLQWAARHDSAALNRSRAIKFVGNLYGKSAIVEMFADAPDQSRIGDLAGSVTSGDRNRRDQAIEELASIAPLRD
jgi:HEAT repeat protein